MTYRSRSARRLARKSRRNFIITLLLIGFLLYATIQWILPTLITGLGFIRQNIIKSTINPSQKNEASITENASLAPPVLNIPYEATNTAQINIRGYGTPSSKVAIFLDDEKQDTVDVSSDGSFEFKNIPLVLGTNNIYGKSIDPDFIGVDENDKESLPSKTIKIIYDNENPPLEIFEPEDGKTIQGGDEQSSSSNRKIKIAGKTEPNARLYINDNQTVVDKEGKFESVQSLNDVENIFNIKSQDSAGNFTEISRRIIFQP